MANEKTQRQQVAKGIKSNLILEQWVLRKQSKDKYRPKYFENNIINCRQIFVAI